MKKLTTLLLVAVLIFSLVGCTGQSSSSGNTKLTIGASPTPHAVILQKAKEALSKQGIELEIKEFTDYILPNQALSNKELDANFFQHEPYLNHYNQENNTEIVSLGLVHFEPLALYAGKLSSLDELKQGSKIGVPNDTTNEARALLLLESVGVITLKEGAGLLATVQDIVENPKGVEIVELSAETVALTLKDLDMGVLNGNNALNAGLKAGKDSIAAEVAGSDASLLYGNLVAVRKGEETKPELLKLLEVLQSEEIVNFINQEFEGSVVPVK